MAKKGKILIVDDEKINCSVLISLLGDYSTIIALNGEQAIQRALSDQPPDLILLDVIMPDLDGYEVCRLLKNNDKTKHIPIIFITVKATEAEEAKGLNLGAVDYISNPFSPAIVLARVSNHMELKRQRDLLEHLHITDALTGIANRRRFDISLEHEWNRTTRMKACISLIMIDIDFFKQFNDIYGHAAGDDCLQKVAQALDKVCVREIDLLARYGGGGFVAGLPSTDLEGAMVVAQAMKDCIVALEIPHEGNSISDCISISLGVSSNSKQSIKAPQVLLKQADDALYKAKSNGRNQFSD
ncbi:MAG: response regulator receiver modulated diguanylate cyclase [Osedax symbiont Rs2]|nr:MAG: response regulator receiver modulated diguanylate cyclase [Osedax symbiont Rs2]